MSNPVATLPEPAPASGDADLVLRHHVLAKSQLTLLDGRLTTHTRSHEAGTSARVRRGGYWGFAARDGAGGAVDAAALADQARRNAQALARFGARAEGPLPGRGHRGLHPVAQAPEPGSARVVDCLQQVDAWCRRELRGVDSVRLIASTEVHDKHIRSSAGADAQAQIRRSLLVVALVGRDAQGQPLELVELISAKGGLAELPLAPGALEPTLRTLHGHLMAKRDAVPARGGEHTVVMHAALAGILAHEAMGHPCEADIVLGGAVTGDLLGQAIASPLVSLVDLAHSWRGEEVMMPVHVDDEGTPAADALLIDRGRLVGLMHSRETALRMSASGPEAERYAAVTHRPTGSARAYGPLDEPLVRMRNTVILPGDSRFDDMVAGVDEGYLLLKTSNGQADTTTEFMFGVPLAYEIRGGRIGRAVQHTTVSGSALKVLRDVDAVSDEMVFEAAGYCGKGQPMVVSMGGPAIRTRARIGGQ